MPKFLPTIVLCLALTGDYHPSVTAAPPPNQPVSAPDLDRQPPSFWVEQLGSDSFAMRQRASHELQLAGTRATAALREGLSLPDLEIRKRAASLLQLLEVDDFEAERLRLRQATESGQTYRLPGWLAYRDQAGDTAASRRLFAELAGRYRQELHDLETNPKQILADPLQAAESATAARLLARLTAGDAVAWTLSLTAVNAQRQRSCSQAHQIRSGLASSRCQTKLQASPHAEVLKRLIAHFLEHDAEHPLERISLRLALQWECTPQALALARQATSPQHRVSPGCLSLALIVLTRHAPDEARPRLLESLHDARTAQVWQIVATTRRRLQTQVSDVALAMLLTLEQVDPRDVGFQDLEADPLTIYREHTMGFANEQSRQAAHQAARRATEQAASLMTPIRLRFGN